MELADASADVLEAVAALLDVSSLIALEQVCRALRLSVRTLVPERCKRECLGAYLFPTIATYRMQAPVPSSWTRLYLTFSRLRSLRWSKAKSDGVSTSLRSLKSDNQEYLVDLDEDFLIRSGGHYWFSVWQTRVADIALGRSVDDDRERELTAALGRQGDTQSAPLEFLRSPRQIVVGKWEKIRAAGRGPCPRRYHSMTCLPKLECPKRFMDMSDVWTAKKPAASTQDDKKPGASAQDDDPDPGNSIRVRRVVFFGGHSESMPFDAFNDLHLLFISDSADSSGKIRAAWVDSVVSGSPPAPRCGHTATLLSPELLLIAGGSNGTTPIPLLEVHLLHIDGVLACRWSTPSSKDTPMGRSLHDVYRVSRSEVIIYGGRQIRQSNGLLDVHRLRIVTNENEPDPCVEWSLPRLKGSLPSGRRGHSTNAVGENLLLFGGQDEATGQLENDVRVLDVPSLTWRRVDVPGDAPCPRRGFKNQFFGTSLVISSGFVREGVAGKAEHQLPDSDVHVLSFL